MFVDPEAEFQATRTFPTACITPVGRCSASRRWFQATRTFPMACIRHSPQAFLTACIPGRTCAANPSDPTVSGDTNFSNGLHHRSLPVYSAPAGFRRHELFQLPASTGQSVRVRSPTRFRRHELFQRPASSMRGATRACRHVSGDTNFSNGLHPTRITPRCTR